MEWISEPYEAEQSITARKRCAIVICWFSYLDLIYLAYFCS